MAFFHISSETNFVFGLTDALFKNGACQYTATYKLRILLLRGLAVFGLNITMEKRWLDCLEQKLAKCMLPAHDKRA